MAAPGPTKIFGHRGASGALADNSAEAFAEAVAQGADGVELDVRRTADGVLVVHHDPHLTDGRNIIDHPKADLPAELLTLEEALAACAPLEVNVEIKSDASEPDYDPTFSIIEPVLEVLHREPRERFEISSFDATLMARVRELDPEMPTGQLVLNGLDQAEWAKAADAGHTSINPHWMTVDENLVVTCRELGLGVNVWTCDDPEAIKRLSGWGVRSIIANNPAQARESLA